MSNNKDLESKTIVPGLRVLSRGAAVQPERATTCALASEIAELRRLLEDIGRKMDVVLS